MATSSKQDRQGARTPADLERKYKFGKNFAEVVGTATDAQRAAEKAAAGVDALDKKLDNEEIFNRFTNNGEWKGIYRGDDGDIYIDATYIKSGELVADLIKSGVIQSVGGKGSFITVDLDNGSIIVCGTNPKKYVHLFQDDVSVYGENTWAVYDSDGFQAENEISGNSIFCSVNGTRSLLTGLTAPVDDADAVNKAYVDERSTNYIVESGTSGIWRYKKYSDGTCDLFGTTTKTVDFSSLTDLVGRSDVLSESLPFHVHNQCVSVDCADVNAWCSVAPSSGADSVSFNLWRRWAYQSTVYEIQIQVKGTWR